MRLIAGKYGRPVMKGEIMGQQNSLTFDVHSAVHASHAPTIMYSTDSNFIMIVATVIGLSEHYATVAFNSIRIVLFN